MEYRTAAGLEGNDVLKLGQGDDTGVCGNDQNDKLYGGQRDDDLGGSNTTNCYSDYENEANSGRSYEGGDDLLKSRDNVSGKTRRRWREHRHLRDRRAGHGLQLRPVRR